MAADLSRKLDRSRYREVEIAAAHALVAKAKLWTLNRRDFVGNPGLELHVP